MRLPRCFIQISKIERGERGDWDSLSDLRLIAKTLEVPIEELVKDERVEVDHGQD